jgi:haloalkane dehalogenase
VTGRVTFVVHDWGSALGFDWAMRHTKAVRGIAYMEAIFTTMQSWDQWPESSRELFQALRTDQGEEMVLKNNLFVETILPGWILRVLDDEEMAEYRRPYLEPGESRLPTLTWPRQIPAEGRPADVTRIVEEYAHWLRQRPGFPSSSRTPSRE